MRQEILFYRQRRRIKKKYGGAAIEGKTIRQTSHQPDVATKPFMLQKIMSLSRTSPECKIVFNVCTIF
jgi:hypothetical protein